MNRFGYALLGVAMLFGCSDDNNGTPDSPTGSTVDARVVDAGATADASTVDAGGAAVFHVTASQANETGPNEPCANAAAGAAATSTVTVSADNSTVTVTNITFTSLSGKPVMAHLHFGATGVAGPIVFGFQNLPSADSGTGTIPDQSFTDTNFTPPSGITDFADAVSKLKAGMFYMNLHTGMCGSGEVRGQVVP
jgi:CHRD domain